MYSNKKSQYAAVKRAVRKRIEWLNSLKAGKPCVDCKIVYPPFVLDWHHVNPALKKFSIGQGKTRHSREKLIAEIAKCILLCANCHRIRENT